MIENSAVRTPALTNSAARPPALICVLGSAGQVVLALVGLAVPKLGLDAEPMVWLSVLLAVLQLQQVAGVLAIWQSRLAGEGAVARIGLGMARSGESCSSTAS